MRHIRLRSGCQADGLRSKAGGLRTAIRAIYCCERLDSTLGNCKPLSFQTGLPVDALLATIKWLFIEQDINWLRLRDITLSYALPKRILPNGSVFLTATDLFLVTNYSGLDPLGSGTTVATGGSGSAGIDFGGFPMPRTINFGIRTTLR